MSTTTKATCTTVPDLAEELAVDQIKVLRWISSGQLRAYDISDGRGRRPRWRIYRSDLEAFLRKRAARPEEPRPRRKSQDESGNWF